MGLIRAAMGAAGGTLADQWKEYFYCHLSLLRLNTLQIRMVRVIIRGDNRVIIGGT